MLCQAEPPPSTLKRLTYSQNQTCCRGCCAAASPISPMLEASVIHAAAALRIQSAWRARVARCLVRQRLIQRRAALCLQYWWRAGEWVERSRGLGGALEGITATSSCLRPLRVGSWCTHSTWLAPESTSALVKLHSIPPGLTLNPLTAAVLLRSRLKMLAAARAAVLTASSSSISSIMCLDVDNLAKLLAPRAPQLFPEQKLRFVFSPQNRVCLVNGSASSPAGSAADSAADSRRRHGRARGGSSTGGSSPDGSRCSSPGGSQHRGRAGLGASGLAEAGSSPRRSLGGAGDSSRRCRCDMQCLGDSPRRGLPCWLGVQLQEVSEENADELVQRRGWRRPGEQADAGQLLACGTKIQVVAACPLLWMHVCSFPGSDCYACMHSTPTPHTPPALPHASKHFSSPPPTRKHPIEYSHATTCVLQELIAVHGLPSLSQHALDEVVRLITFTSMADGAERAALLAVMTWDPDTNSCVRLKPVAQTPYGRRQVRACDSVVVVVVRKGGVVAQPCWLRSRARSPAASYTHHLPPHHTPHTSLHCLLCACSWWQWHH